MGYADFTKKSQPEIVDSAVESAKFGMRISRASSGDWERHSKQFLADILQCDSDVVILRTRDVKPELEFASPNFSVIAAGTLTYWSSGQNPSFKALEENMSYSPAAESLEDYLSIQEDCFSGYRNHYSYNSLFNKITPCEAYLDWAKSQALSNDVNYFSGVLRVSGEPVGAMTGFKDEEIIELALGGIRRDFKGRGLNSYLMSAFWESASPTSSSRCVISTQLENIDAQASWKKLNFHQDFDVYTTHLVRKTLGS